MSFPLVKRFTPLFLLLSLLSTTTAHALGFGSFSPVPGGAATNNAPAPVVYNNNLYQFITGQGDGKLYYAMYNGSSWSAYQPVPGGATTNYQPAVVTYQGYNQTYIVLYITGQTDGKLYYTIFDGSSWQPYASITNIVSNTAPGVAVFNGFIYQFIQQASNGQVYYLYYDFSGHVSNVMSLPYAFTTFSSPAPVVFNNNLYVFARDASSNQIIYTRTPDGQSYTSPVPIPGNATTSANPAPVVFNNSLYVFNKGANNGNAAPTYFTASLNGNNWTGDSVVNSNAYTNSAPGVTVFNNSLYFFNRGASDNKLYYAVGN